MASVSPSLNQLHQLEPAAATLENVPSPHLWAHSHFRPSPYRTSGRLRGSDCSRWTERCRIIPFTSDTTELELNSRSRERGFAVAAIDDRQTADQNRIETDHRGGRSGRVAGAPRRRRRLRLSGRCEHAAAPGPDAVPRPDPDDLAPPRARGHLRGRGICPRQRQAGRGDGDLRARGAQPGHRPGRRQDGLRAAGRRSPARFPGTSSAPTRFRKRRWSRFRGRSPSTITWSRTPRTSRGSSRRRFIWPAPAGPGRC